MKRVTVPFLLAIAALALGSQAANAQTPATPLLSFYETATGGTFNIIDAAPASPVKNPDSKKYRFSNGDQLLFSNPVLDHKGGKRIATEYGHAAVVKGTRFSTGLTVIAQVVFVFTNGDEITASGVFTFSGTNKIRVPIVGGTGAYQGARGTITNVSAADGSSTDTLTLVP